MRCMDDVLAFAGWLCGVLGVAVFTLLLGLPVMLMMRKEKPRDER